MEFIQEEAFRRQGYDKLVSRIHYDERDAVCYYNMLSFLWPYVIDKIHLEDREGILEEYIHWNGQLIDHCYYHPHDLPYVNARRAWQSVCCLLAGKTEEGEELQIEDLEIFENVAYIMAYHADHSIPGTIDEWLDQFEMFSIYEVLPEILELWGTNLITDVESKKNLQRVAGK